ncbi:hypothetical protein F9B85_10190 [Heliorestis acidaminivorans]|uniref:Uncharacterized protein n=1 Tax=Heliorestis acidaminivorans TaxID=553427 RepID=A0A6I0EZ82_9FIRM|nr:hypothetical protein [Heliorestis acidaminivorans]KAB2952172.1 hypothetical protein F9B85_10190 [Heliorestis acidaminivorans]
MKDSWCRDLFFRLYYADSADEVHHICINDSALSNPDNWLPYGGKKSNAGTFENQQSNPIPALAEKITNGIDSILVKECRLANLNPEGPPGSGAPRSMEDAVALFFGVRNLNWSDVARPREIAKRIQVIATGDRKTPNITVFDDGEGQHPDHFPDTFLSIGRGNKVKIPFVQGRFNMGSTGAVTFCGGHRYQLIGSMVPAALNGGTTSPFGFTLVRRHIMTENERAIMRSAWYEYFAPNGMVPRFKAIELDLSLHNKMPINGGAVVKLYSYQLPTGSRSDFTLDMYRDLNQYLYKPAIPLLIYEKRGYGGHSDSKVMLGNRNRILVDDRNNVEKIIAFELERDDIGKLAIEATVFKSGVNRNEYIKDKAVVFSLNGQVHGYLPRSFISQEVQFGMLRDCMLVHVDCSNTKVHQDLFMASRDRLREGPVTKSLLDVLVRELKQNHELRELNRMRRNQLIDKDAKSTDLIRNLAKKLHIDSDLTKLISKDSQLTFLGKVRRSAAEHLSGDKQRIDSKRFPTIFKLQGSKENNKQNVKAIPLGGNGILKFETDVENEYFVRTTEPGELQVKILTLHRPNKADGGTAPGIPSEPTELFDIRKTGPSEGTIRLSLMPKESKLSVGDQIEVSVSLTSPDGDREVVVWIKVVESRNENPEDPPSNREAPPTLPEAIEVFQNNNEEKTLKTWADYNWNGEEVVTLLIDGGTIQAIAINMDSPAIRRYLGLKRNLTENIVTEIKRRYFVNMYMHSLFLYGTMEKFVGNKHFNNIEINEVIEKTMRGYGLFLLEMEDKNLLAE